MIGDLGGAFDNIHMDVLLTTMPDMDLPGITDPTSSVFDSHELSVQQD